MTIAAGFEFDGGLLFCADTKITSDIKTHESKLFFNSFAERQCATVFAVAASDFNVAKAAVRDCEESVRRVNMSTATIESIRNCIQSALTKFHKIHVFPNPEREKIAFQFLLGIWLRGETQMYASQETVLNRVRGYECVGTGAYLAKFLIKQARPSDHPTLDEIGLIAKYALESAERHDQYVGGEIEFITMKRDGEIGSSSGATYPTAQFPAEVQRLMWDMLRKLTEIEDRDKRKCESVIDDFWLQLLELSERDRWLLDSIRKSKERKDS